MTNVKFRPVGRSQPVVVAKCTQRKRGFHSLAMKGTRGRSMAQLTKHMAAKGFVRARG